ncbi:MAG: DUF3333 domain-containing protein, partial [Pseudomonadota bacterium]
MTSIADPREFSGPATASSRDAVEASLRKRRRSEAIFKALGLGGILVGIALVAVLFGSILARGLPAFTQATLHLEVTFDPQIINIPEKPVQQAGQSDADFEAELISWQRRLVFVNWNRIVQNALAQEVPAAADNPRDAIGMVASGERVRIRDMVREDPE